MNEQHFTSSTPAESTDLAWEEWGKRDPYFGVITNPKFRRDNLSAEAKAEFFESGRHHIEHFFQVIRHHVDPAFQPRRAMDFGCGVGRISIPLAAKVAEVMAVDVSPSMLQEAQRNALEMGVNNMVCVPSDDELSQVTGEFDFIHSSIVFQHIPPVRGRAIFSELLHRLAPNGVCAVHFLYSKAQYAENHGLPPTPVAREPLVAPLTNGIGSTLIPTARAAGLRTDLQPEELLPPLPPESAFLSDDRQSETIDPDMQMNTYHMNEIMFMIQQSGVARMHIEFSDHGGELGMVLFFRKSH